MIKHQKKNKDYLDCILGFVLIFKLLLIFTALKGDFEGATITGAILKSLYTGIEKISKIIIQILKI